MKENNSSSYLEHCQKLPPQEKFAEFQRIWKLIPNDAFKNARRARELEDMDPILKNALPPEDIPDYYPNQEYDTMDRRENSETLEMLSSKLNTLLSTAPVTQSFQTYLVASYKLIYPFGISKDENYSHFINDFLWVFDEKEKLAFFDENKSMQYEQQAYHQALKEYFHLEKVHEMVFEKLGYSDEEHGEIRKSAKESEQLALLKKWKAEFIERYHDEP